LKLTLWPWCQLSL